MSSALRTAVLLAALFPLCFSAVGAADHHPGPVVPLCSRSSIVFTASYLAQTHTGGGPGFLFRIENHTAKLIRLAEPVPSSAHWYARVGSKWLWRASSGSGGSLVNAIQERGPVFAYRSGEDADPQYLTIPAHGKYEWTAGERDNPVLDYQPRCAHCNYPGEHDYKAVFAYAWLPSQGQSVPHLLRCGLRSNLVDMPPKPEPK